MKHLAVFSIALVCACSPKPAETVDSAKWEALAAWQEATGGRFPRLEIDVYATDATYGRAASTATFEGVARIRVDARLSPRMARRALLHELGHAAGLVLDPGSGDPHHWHGMAASVMRRELDESSDDIGQPDLAAFDLKYGK